MTTQPPLPDRNDTVTISPGAGPGTRATMLGMTYHSIPADPLSDPWEGAPAYVRAAALRKARAFRVLRLYHRRGWNPTAVVTEYARASEGLGTALTRWEHEETNPPLF